MSELGNEKPNMNKLLSGYASVDPVAAMKTQAGMKTVDPTKKSIRELEQLWKDAERSLRYAKQQGDSVGANYYTRLQKKLTDQLKVLRPEIWGDTPTETINNGTVKEEVGAPAITDTKVIKKALQDSAKDADKDGLIDNVTSWRDTITEWKRENKLADDRSEVKDVMVFAENLISEIADKHRGVLEKINRGQDDRKQRMTEDEKYQKVWETKTALVEEPSITNKRAAINVVLRDESGAAIGADEFNNMMSFVLPQAFYKTFKEETTGIETTLLGMVSTGAREEYMRSVAEKYLGNVSADKLSQYMKRGVPKDYYRRKTDKKIKKKKEKVGDKPVQKDFPTRGSYLKALMLWRKKGGK
jgi:hypothetical protein